MARTEEFEVKVVRHLTSSLVVEIDDRPNEEFIIPYSQIDLNGEIDEDSDVGEEGVLIIPQWLAKDRGLL